MASCIAQYFVTFFVMTSNTVVFPVSGQCTVQGCEVGDPSISIVAEIQEIKNQQDVIIKSLHAVDRRSLEQGVCMKQIQGIYDFLNVSFRQLSIQQDMQEQTVRDKYVHGFHALLNASLHQLQNQQDTILTGLQTVDRRSQEEDAYIKQVQSFNISLREIKDQQDTVMTSLQTADRRSQEQVQSMFKFLNSSLQQMKIQQNALTTKLQAVDRRLSIYETSMSNKTQVLYKLAKAFGIGNWIVILHRFDGFVDFCRNWDEYRNGFGDKEEGEFWLGNEEVHRLTNRFMYTLRIEVQPRASRVWYYAEYSTFSLGSEDNKYTLRLSGYSGNAGDTLINTSLESYGYLGGMKFSTSDNDNDRFPDGSCAQSWSGGWWFNNCFHGCLTCHYLNHFKWYHPSGWPTSGLLRAARMMIKSK